VESHLQQRHLSDTECLPGRCNQISVTAQLLDVFLIPLSSIYRITLIGLYYIDMCKLYAIRAHHDCLRFEILDFAYFTHLYSVSA